MKVLMINVVCGIRSTGRICTDIATSLEAQGHEVKIAYGREKVPKQFQKYAIKIGSEFDVLLHGVKARLFDGAGFGSKIATKKFVEWIKEYDPDVIHLHNIHGYYINVEVLFNYLRTCGKKIIWTLHDCWSFTGHCVYFDYIGCEKWKIGCNHCPQKKEYPSCIGIDLSQQNYALKKSNFTKIPNMVLVTPSKWLADLVLKSYMSEYPIFVINNGIDTEKFKPINSNVKDKYNCQGKKIILGVAAVWNKRKGLDSFIELNKKLNTSYQIILVGLNKKQIKQLPKNILGIERTNSVRELAALYSAADFFVNPTLEDNYPTTNLEAIACGTPVISYNTGGSHESAQIFGMCVKKNDIDALVSAIENINAVNSNNSKIDKLIMINKYSELYIKNENVRKN